MRYATFLLAAFLLLTGCDTLNGEEETPSYVGEWEEKVKPNRFVQATRDTVHSWVATEGVCINDKAKVLSYDAESNILTIEDPSSDSGNEIYAEPDGEELIWGPASEPDQRIRLVPTDRGPLEVWSSSCP